jgi:hypothetical protein
LRHDVLFAINQRQFTVFLKKMKKFTKINDSFVCEYCGEYNPPANKTCRDHCIKCLCSKHVDKNPGDRAETCHGKLIPIKFTIKSAEIKQIIFKCDRCSCIRKNKPAEDDNKNLIWEIMNNQ